MSKPAQFFYFLFEGGPENLKKVTSVSTKALEAACAVSLLVTKSKKPFTMVKELILPAAVVLPETMMGKKVADVQKNVPLSSNTVNNVH